MRHHHREILKLLPKGYTIGGRAPDQETGRIVGGKNGHLYVLKPDGEPLRGPSGIPILVANSPARYRTLQNDLTRVRRALGL